MTPDRPGRPTHVLKYNGGTFSIEIGPRADISTFLEPLSLFNGQKPWALTLVPLPNDLDYDEVLSANMETNEFLQAGGRADAMTVEIRKPGGQQWGVESVWAVVGRSHNDPEPLDVPIVLPRSTQMISKSEVFTADEAAKLFYAYYKNGDLPSGYTLRPISGWTSEGKNVDLREQAV